MPRKKGNWSKSKKSYQSKLQDKKINTKVEKRMQEIARKEDKKNMVKYVHVSYLKPAALNWSAGYLAHNPPPSLWYTLPGASDMSIINASQIGGNIELLNMVNVNNAHQGDLEVRIHGIQSYGIFKNNSAYPARVETRLLYIPNTNVYTDDANDYLTPRFTMLWKDGKGIGVPLRKGYNKRQLAAFTATGIPVKYQELDKQVIFLPPATVTGTINLPPMYDGDAGHVEAISMNTPVVYKRTSMAKYFKTPRKAYIRPNNSELTNGNYFLVVWTDLPNGTDTVSCLMTNNLQYSIKAPFNKDVIV